MIAFPKLKQSQGFRRQRQFAVLWVVLRQFPDIAACCRWLHVGRGPQGMLSGRRNPDMSGFGEMN